MELEFDQSVAAIVDKHEMGVWDLWPVFTMMDALPLRSFAMQRYQHSKGLDPDHAVLYNVESRMAQELRVINDEIIDDFLVYTLNSFEFCYISRPSLGALTEPERRWFIENVEARAYIYDNVKLDPELSGRFIRFQRIGKSIFLVTPKH